MKTIGVLGGLGPQATTDFEQRIHRVSQKLIPQYVITGYPPMVVYYFREPPAVVGPDRMLLQPIQPNPHLFEAARQLGSLADFLVIPSNFPHLFKKEIEEASGRPVLSLIATTLDEVSRREPRKVGVLGFGLPTVYLRPMEEMGLPYEIIDEQMRNRLDQAIFALQEGRETPESTAVVKEAVDILRAKDVDLIILGCTELPLLLGDATNAPNLINPAQLLAEAAVRHALN
jgi:aspartate racemase